MKEESKPKTKREKMNRSCRNVEYLRKIISQKEVRELTSINEFCEKNNLNKETAHRFATYIDPKIRTKGFDYGIDLDILKFYLYYIGHTKKVESTKRARELRKLSTKNTYSDNLLWIEIKTMDQNKSIYLAKSHHKITKYINVGYYRYLVERKIINKK